MLANCVRVNQSTIIGINLSPGNQSYTNRIGLPDKARAMNIISHSQTQSEFEGKCSFNYDISN